MNPTARIQLTLKISVVLSVRALVLRATLQDGTYLFRAPGKLARTLLAMDVAIPLFALALAPAFDLNPAARPPNLTGSQFFHSSLVTQKRRRPEFPQQQWLLHTFALTFKQGETS